MKKVLHLIFCFEIGSCICFFNVGRVLRKVSSSADFFDKKKQKRDNEFNWNTIPEVRLIDENGEMVGIVPTNLALRKAKEANLELVNVSPKAVPPVCKICDYGKFKYEQQKKNKGNHKSAVGKLKEVQFSIGISDNDIDIKLKKVIEFLSEKSRVQLVMQLKGRDMPRVDFAMEVMKNICGKINGYYKIIDGPKLTGRKIIALLQ